MSTKRWQSASDFMADLERDPDFIKRKAEQARKLAEQESTIASMMAPLLEDLERQTGVRGTSIEGVTAGYAPLEPEVIRVFLEWLPKVRDDRIKESIVRALGAAREPFDGRPLVEVFTHDVSELLRWPIANSIAESKPYGISDWLVNAAQNSRFGSARQLLLLALARLVPPETSLPILRAAFQDFPLHAARAIAEVGGSDDLEFLRHHANEVAEGLRSELGKVLSRFEKRLTAR